MPRGWRSHWRDGELSTSEFIRRCFEADVRCGFAPFYLSYTNASPQIKQRPRFDCHFVDLPAMFLEGLLHRATDYLRGKYSSWSVPRQGPPQWTKLDFIGATVQIQKLFCNPCPKHSNSNGRTQHVPLSLYHPLPLISLCPKRRFPVLERPMGYAMQVNDNKAMQSR